MKIEFILIHFIINKQNKMNYLILFLFLFKIVFNGTPVAELKAEEETESECYNTPNPENEEDCLDQEVIEGDKYCCLFEIETNKKEKKKRCAGLTVFQYENIKLYVKEKMDQLLYRDLYIHCDSIIIKKNRMLSFLSLVLFILY